jgi:Glycosyl hydrolases family 2, TIM barrel domain/Glycosyl hydrolases family 2, sugar binding domain/Glycosyl hydrolases family 2
MKHGTFAGFALTVCFVSQLIGQGKKWSPVDGSLMTRWAADVSPESVWSEYPRPQMVRRDWTSLNGLWSYAIRPMDDGPPTQWDGQILVPFCVESSLSGVGRRVEADEALWYRRVFLAPEHRPGRLLLHFGAVDWEATVWLNGVQVGTHRGGYDPFTIDITDAVRPGEQEIVVKVVDPTDRGWQPRGKQVSKPGGIWYTPVTGIWQTVWLEPVASTHIDRLRIVPDIETNSVGITVESTASAKVELQVRADDRVVGRGSGVSGEEITINVGEMRLWSPDDPFLYDVRIRLIGHDSEDQVGSYFGMRSIAVGKDDDGVNRLLLNGEPLFQFGLLDQGWWPDGLYTAPSDAALRYDIEITKRLGFNTARKHVKVESARWYDWCDRLGLLVWQDMPSGETYIGGDTPDIERSPESAQGFERELHAMVDHLSNHPSVVMWVPYNEGWGQWDTPRICDLIKSWDPTRPVNNASGWTDRGVGDVLDIHRYPGPAMAKLEEDRAVVLGEFGGLGLPMPGHTWQAEKNWGYQSYETRAALTDAYVDLLRQLRPMIGQGLAAAIYTQTSDVEIEVNGVMTYDRALIKVDEARAAQAVRNLYLPPPTIVEIVASSQREAQTWRFTFDEPDEGWTGAAFDDRSWRRGPGGFGEASTPGAHVRTAWKTQNIWVRRTFELGEVPDDLMLLIHHDEDAEVYLNGVLAMALKGYVTGYTTTPIAADALAALHEGENVISIHCRQTTGGQYIDAGLVRVIEQDADQAGEK